MIFVTVGTHEQQFNRLIKAVDALVEAKTITEDVLVQSGYCTYQPAYCRSVRFLSAASMAESMRNASVVITHGGPSSFIEAMAAGKTPVVVPRSLAFGEHVNDHQVDFVRAVSERQGGIIPCYDIAGLAAAIKQAHDATTNLFESHNLKFREELSGLLRGL